MNIPVNIFLCVATAMSKDTTRYILNGIEVTPKKNGVTLCATNGMVIIAGYVGGENKIENPFIIPAHLVNYITAKTKMLEMGIANKTVSLNTGFTDFRATVIDGNYPNWRKTIKPTGDLIEHMPKGMSRQVLDVIFKAQAALEIKNRGISDVYCEDDRSNIGTHYMKLADDVVCAFAPLRGNSDDVRKFVWPDWAA